MNDIRRVLSYNDVLLVPRNSELQHLTDADIKIKYNHSIPGYSFTSPPIINAPMDKVVSPQLIHLMCTKFFMPTTIHRFFKSVEEQIAFCDACYPVIDTPNCFVAVGIVEKWKEWIDKLNEYKDKHEYAFGILVDVANGDTKSCIDTVKYLKGNFSSTMNIMAGNVATRSGFARLQDAGANFIRVGIGGGSICSTRTTTGFGMPTLTSVFDCAKVKETAYLIADGGIETPGDICKAMAAGADMCMLGKMLASTNLSNGEKFDKDMNATNNEEEYKWVAYSGMASKEAIQKLGSKKSVVSVEGVSGLIPYTGTTNEVVSNIIGNLQSSVAYYAGCKNWDEFRRKVKIVEITTQGWGESLTRVKM